jgi:hemerythrin-like domain-containing protein
MAKHEEATGSTGVLELLREDHRKVKEMFSRFEKEQANKDDEQNAELVHEISVEVMVHAALEEALFYPAAVEALGEERLVDQALVEHQSARTLIDQLAGDKPEEEMWTARVHVLGEYIAHHIEEEEKVIFPKLQKAGFGSREMAEEVLKHKKTLMEQAKDLNLKELAALAVGGGKRGKKEKK